MPGLHLDFGSHSVILAVFNTFTKDFTGGGVLTVCRLTTQELQKKQMDLMTPLLEKARNAITKVGKEQGFNYVIDSSPNGGLILAEGKDLIEDVKRELGF